MIRDVMSQTSYKLPSPLITVSAEWLAGEPCFTGWRVPVTALFDTLESGQTVQEFIEDYPSVSREHAVAVIDLANRAVALPDAAE